MSDVSAIEWTDATWNTVTGCTKVSPGCANCYIASTPPFRMAGRKFVNGAIPLVFHPKRMNMPLRWRKPRRVFVNSLSDLFHEDVPEEFIWDMFGVMRRAPQHTFQILTKRPERMRDVMVSIANASRFNPSRHQLGGEHPAPNVWLGVTVENQHFADERIPILLDTPAAVRFLSVEPMLGPVDLSARLPSMVAHFKGEPTRDLMEALSRAMHAAARMHGPTIDWVICGGESGPKRRPFDLAWARSLREQCAAAGVAYFFKQTSALRAGTPSGDPDLDACKEFPK